MKKLLLFIALLNILPFVYCQEFEPIVDTTKKWNILHTTYFEGNQYYSTSSYIIGEDVEINGVMYHRIILNGNANTGQYIREDSINNVYYYNSYVGELLLYDFNLEIGDEIGLYNEYEEDFELWTVINVETVFFAEKYRKKIELEHNDIPDMIEIWHEGIGSQTGLLKPGCFWIDYDESLLCFYQDNELLIQNGSSCNISNDPIPDVNFFKNNTFIFSHFLIDESIIEEPDGAFEAQFTAMQGATNNEIDIQYFGMCGNLTSANILVNNDDSMTVLERGATTLGSCYPITYPQGNQQEARFFDIQTGNIYMQPNNPLPVYYEISTDGLLLSVWNSVNEKLFFNVEENIGIADHSSDSKIVFYPNPVDDVLNISTSMEVSQVQIFNNMGQMVLSQKFKNHIDVSELSCGFYIIKVESEQGDYKMEKVIKL